MSELAEVLGLLADPKRLAAQVKTWKDERAKLDLTINKYRAAEKLAGVDEQAAKIIAKAEAKAAEVVADADAYKANEVAGFDRRVARFDTNKAKFEDREKEAQLGFDERSSALAEAEKRLAADMAQYQKDAKNLASREARLEKTRAEVDGKVAALKAAKAALEG